LKKSGSPTLVNGGYQTVGDYTNIIFNSDINTVSGKFSIGQLKNFTGSDITSGYTLNIVVSQIEGVLPTLTEFHYIKTEERFGIDGSLTTHLIKTGMAFSALDSEDVPNILQEIYIERAENTLKNYLKVVTSPKSDQVFAGVPKYSSRNEICTYLNENHPEVFQQIPLTTYNDKAMLSLVLRPEEIVGPIKLQKRIEEEGKWHLSGENQMKKYLGSHYKKDYVDPIISALDDLYVIYYKPSTSQPALRVEIPKKVAKNEARLSLVIKALQDQSKFPGIIEPYPLYLADLFVKHLGGVLSEIKDITISDLAILDVKMNPVDVLLAMHEYRSVGGYE
jgi:hypothetical protein